MRKTYKVKAQRPIIPLDAPVLIYSKCGTIPPTFLPYEGPLKEALAGRYKAYFKCSVEGTTLQLLKELKRERW